MIEQEVEKQLAKPNINSGKRKTGRHIPKRRLAVAVAAATLALGTTVFAGVLYGLKNNRVGNYAYETKQERQDGVQDGTVASADLGALREDTGLLSCLMAWYRPRKENTTTGTAGAA